MCAELYPRGAQQAVQRLNFHPYSHSCSVLSASDSRSTCKTACVGGWGCNQLLKWDGKPLKFYILLADLISGCCLERTVTGWLSPLASQRQSLHIQRLDRAKVLSHRAGHLASALGVSFWETGTHTKWTFMNFIKKSSKVTSVFCPQISSSYFPKYLSEVCCYVFANSDSSPGSIPFKWEVAGKYV